MSLKISVKNLDKVDRLFRNLKKSIKPVVIDRGLDKTLAADLASLKIELLNFVNNEIKSKVTIQKDQGQTEEVTIKNSDQEIIKHITGVDLANVSKTKDFNTLADGKVAVVSNKTLQKATIDRMNGGPTSKMSSGVNLRLPMSDADTFDNQYAQALDYYNKATFVFVDNNGKANYYMNPGIDMTQYVKVVCSRSTGKEGRSESRWEQHRDRRGYADWTLLQEGLDKVKKDFVNITDALDKVKEGQPDEAKAVLTKVAQKSSVAINISEKIDDLKDNKKLDSSVEGYNNLLKLILNLKLEKSIKKDRTFYTLVSNYDENVEDYKNFQDRLVKYLRMWKISNEQKWIDQLVNSTVKLISKLLR